MTTKLLIATTNRGKLKEYREMLAGLPFEVMSLEDAGITLDVEETGETFEENAILKAKTYAAMSGMLTLADDSGLEVDALGGEPGVRSARYAGEGAPRGSATSCCSATWRRRTALTGARASAASSP